jgi:hypothetical protein
VKAGRKEGNEGRKTVVRWRIDAMATDTTVKKGGEREGREGGMASQAAVFLTVVVWHWHSAFSRKGREGGEGGTRRR